MWWTGVRAEEICGKDRPRSPSACDLTRHMPAYGCRLTAPGFGYYGVNNTADRLRLPFATSVARPLVRCFGGYQTKSYSICQGCRHSLSDFPRSLELPKLEYPGLKREPSRPRPLSRAQSNTIRGTGTRYEFPNHFKIPRKVTHFLRLELVKSNGSQMLLAPHVRDRHLRSSIISRKAVGCTCSHPRPTYGILSSAGSAFTKLAGTGKSDIYRKRKW